jgi:hypothetical protein
LEIALNDVRDVNVNAITGGLEVHVSSKSEAATTATTSAAAAVSKPAGPASISKVAVIRGQNGMEVHIQGVTSAKATKITSPDRIVLDVANAVPT